MQKTLQPTRIKAPFRSGSFAARGLVVSPYYPRAWGAIRTTYMNVYAVVVTFQNDFFGNLYISFAFYDTSYNYLGITTVPLSISGIIANGLNATTVAAIVSAATTAGYTVLSTSWSVAQQPVRTFSNPSLAVNTSRQASTTQDALVVASVEIDATLSLTSGAKGTVTLKYADDSAFTTNVVTASLSTNGNTGALSLGINTVGAGAGPVTGIIPAGKHYRLVTTNVTGTPTYGTPVIQEVLL